MTIHAIKFTITFKVGHKRENSFVFSYLNSGFTRAIANYEDADLKFNGLLMENKFGSAVSIQRIVTEYYKTNAIKSAKKILVSFESVGKIVSKLFKIDSSEDLGKKYMDMKKSRAPRIFYGRERIYKNYCSKD